MKRGQVFQKDRCSALPLDKTTTIKLLKNLRKMTDRTVLLVTHRIEQIEIFDKTVSFFKEGSWQISVTDKKEE